MRICRSMMAAAKPSRRGPKTVPRRWDSGLMRSRAAPFTAKCLRFSVYLKPGYPDVFNPAMSSFPKILTEAAVEVAMLRAASKGQ